MGESKRRKAILGNHYGLPNIFNEVQSMWTQINFSLKRVKDSDSGCLLVQCSNNDRGFHQDTIAQIQKEIENWKCDLDIPILIQVLPRGVQNSGTKLFDGFVTLWCNCPEFELWREIFESELVK
ncbi:MULTISPECIES: hypothetical protein [unclassified Nostoc]|jgi:hypothetical protein|uniref:hypothetical protein n=1 Tax=unclassified Nostoc TaxID=2593658 RepID=UPI0013D58ED9|nr:hypothetical protein [Nostoc sp. UIC 10630]NEU83658.1 hypothetical protein [Nostoc sp. UIC 10630]